MFSLLILASSCAAKLPGPLPAAVEVEDEAWTEAIARGRQVLTAAVVDRPAISVTVAVDGERVWSEAHGWARVEPPLPATAGTRFRGYSVAKTITGTLASRLVERGALDLDEPIATYLGDLPEPTGRLTTRELLGHLGGVRNYKRGEWMRLAGQHCDRAVEALEPFAADALESEPGTTFAYSSFHFVLASAVLEAAAGTPYPQLVKQEIFDRSGMTATTLDTPEAYDERTATPYEWKRGPRALPAFDNSCKFGGGSLLTTATDLVRFGVALLDDKLVRPDSLEALFVSQRTATDEPTGYSLGWGISEDGKRIGHSGGAPGGRAYLLVDREHRIVVALLSNVEGGRLNASAREILDAFANASARGPGSADPPGAS